MEMRQGVRVGDLAIVTRRGSPYRGFLGIIETVHQVGAEWVFTVRMKSNQKLVVFRRIDFIHAPKAKEKPSIPEINYAA